FGFNNTFAITVRHRDATRYSLRRISDLTRVAPRWKAGFGYEFLERADGFRGLASVYGLRFASPPTAMDLGLTYRALAEGKVDVIARSPTPVDLARGARGPGLRGRRAAVRVREQADNGGQYCFPPGDESAVRRRARAVAVARARAGGRPGVHGRAGSWPRPAVRRRAATFRDRAGSYPRQRACRGERTGMGVHGDGLPLAGPPRRRGPRPHRGRGGVRQPDRIPGLSAGGAPARGRPRHRLADRDLPRRVSART